MVKDMGEAFTPSFYAWIACPKCQRRAIPASCYQQVRTFIGPASAERGFTLATLSHAAEKAVGRALVLKGANSMCRFSIKHLTTELKKMLCHSINKGFAIACLLSIFILTFVASARQQNFHVTGASLTADDAGMSGPCPMKMVFRGFITANGPGTVKYTFTRSDGATGPAYAIEFKEAGTQAVSADWTLGDASALPHFEGWQAIRILSPNGLESDRALFKGTCLTETPSAKGQFIACPVKETRTEVTTPLPQPWWNTPQIGKLERVSVQTIGGNRTLVCEYWAYGRTVSIMRRFPEGTTDCSAEGSGFSCR
jgi:hypothetical protein